MTESMPNLAQSPCSKCLLPMCNFFETITYVLADTLIFCLDLCVQSTDGSHRQ